MILLLIVSWPFHFSVNFWMFILYVINRGNIYLSRFLRDDKYISPDRRKSSNVLIQAFPSDFPPLPEVPLIEIEYPPAYGKKYRFPQNVTENYTLNDVGYLGEWMWV